MLRFGRSSAIASIFARIAAQSATLSRTSSSVAQMPCFSFSSSAAPRDAIGLEMHDRFGRAGRAVVGCERQQMTAGIARDAEHRMDDRVQRKPGLVDAHADRIDEERHVVGDDLDDRARRVGTAGALAAGLKTRTFARARPALAQ